MNWQPCWIVDDYGSSQIHHRLRIQAVLSRRLLNDFLDIYAARSGDVAHSWLPPLPDGRDRLGVFVAISADQPGVAGDAVRVGGDLQPPPGYHQQEIQRNSLRLHMDHRGIRFDGNLIQQPTGRLVKFKSDRIPWTKLYEIAGLHYVSANTAPSACQLRGTR